MSSIKKPYNRYIGPIVRKESFNSLARYIVERVQEVCHAESGRSENEGIDLLVTSTGIDSERVRELLVYDKIPKLNAKEWDRLYTMMGHAGKTIKFSTLQSFYQEAHKRFLE